MSTNHYSIIIPILNEENTLPILYGRLKEVLENFKENYDIIFINDGSTDNSLNIILGICQKDKNVKLIDFSRNFGHQMAITAGLEHAEGDAVIIMDGDLQDPPEVLPKFIEKWKEGWEVVYAIRKNRKENVIKKTAYNLFYKLLKVISYVNIPLDSGDFSLIDRRIVDILLTLPERNRFVRGLRTWVGFKQIGVEYNRNERYAGIPKYNFRKLLNLAYDGLVSFSYAPLRFATNFGFLIAFLAFSGILIVIFLKLFSDIKVAGWASQVTIILFIGGVQLITIGIIGEYIGKILDEVKQRPKYLIKQKVGLK